MIERSSEQRADRALALLIGSYAEQEGTRSSALHESQAQVHALQAQLDELRASGAMRLAKCLSSLRRAIFPPGSGLDGLWRSLGRVIRRERLVAPPERSDPTERAEEYEDWVTRNEPDFQGLVRQRREVETWNRRPRISILTPVYNTPGPLLDAMIASVVAQTYPDWELCLVDGASNDPATARSLAAWMAREPRVRYRRLQENLGISGNTNVALEMAKGEFIALLDHDDLLPPFALYEVVRVLCECPETDLVYSDKDLVTGDGRRRHGPLVKPALSPETMLSANIPTHLSVVRTAVARAVDGFRPETDGAQDWDFFLRVIEHTHRVIHIPKILYHWRVWERSVSSGIEAKPYARAAQKLGVEEHLGRTGSPGRVAFEHRGHIRVQLDALPLGPISLICAATDGSAPLPQLVGALLSVHEKSGAAIELVVVDCDAAAPWQWLEDLPTPFAIRVVEHVGRSDSPAAWDAGARASTGGQLLFLGEDLTPLDDDWPHELGQWLGRSGVGVAGGMVLSHDGKIESLGLFTGGTGVVGGAFAGLDDGTMSMFGHVDWYRNVSAVPAACMIVGRRLYEEIGGFDPSYQGRGAEVDFCLRARALGQRVMVTPFARFVRRRPHPIGPFPPEDARLLLERHPQAFAKCDPYHNPNLTFEATMPALRGPAEAAPTNGTNIRISSPHHLFNSHLRIRRPSRVGREDRSWTRASDC